MPSPPVSPRTSPRLVGHAVERVEDAALLTGRGRFADDMGERPGTVYAAVLRSPHAHAEIASLDAIAALALPDVVAVLTGEDVAAWSRPFIAGVRQPMQHYPLAVDRVRYAGEPVAVVVARDRYAAEDALDGIEVEYRELVPVVGPVVAATAGVPLLHHEVSSNIVSDRHFRYGDPDTAFANTEHRVAISVRYPRNACTPIEGFVVIAEYLGDNGYDVLSNFQGPFSLHPVMARALGVPGSRLRLRSHRDSGGSFGVKQAIYPYIVAMCLASRKAGCPVKWVEDRLEHLLAATSATNRVTTLEAAVTVDGTITALRWDQLDDCGAYLRAPEPASLYRTHGHMTGPYRIPNLEIRNRVVLTNKTPTGLNRGFGGPQVYFARFNDDAQRSTAAKTRYVRLRQSNFGEFRVPGLRNVALTAPYMHAGSLETLAYVARHYSTIDEERLHAGGERILHRLDLSAREQADLVAFLETLTEKEPLHEFVKKTGNVVCR